jgi:pimeloyl-ACP methyl ester carboxylesterase
MTGFFAVDMTDHQRDNAGVIKSYQLGQGPNLLLLHDVAGSARYWGQTLTEHALDMYRATVIDQRGHGNASYFGAYDMAAFVDDACAVVAELGLTKMIIIGHGLGALQACAVAQRCPERMRALILVDPPWFETPPNIPELRAQWMHRLMELQQLSDEERISRIVRIAHGWTPVAVHAWSDARAQCDTRALTWLDAYAISFNETVQNIQHPTLVIYGDVAHGAHMTPVIAEMVSSLSTHVTCVQINETGHDLYHDRPKAYMKAVHNFLRTIARG